MNERQSRRIAAPIPVMLTVGSERITCLGQSISEGGASLTVDRDLPPGTRAEVLFLDESRRLVVSAQIVSQRGNLVGLRFVELTDAQNEQIAELMTNLLRRAGESSSATSTKNKGNPPITTKVAWAHASEGGSAKGWFHGRRRSATIVEINRDGASLTTRNRPEVGAVVLVMLPASDDADQTELTVTAKVVRHLTTSGAFAVRFESPTIAFRQRIAQLRRGRTSSS